jgi:flagellin
MALQINTNMGALMASAASSSVNKAMETSMNRLSTGLRINAAKDDAAGVAIASRLTSEIRGTNQAIRNAGDAQAMIDTAEGAHFEIESILQRMREIAVQSANDTNSVSDRDNLQAEMDQLVEEIDRIAAVTTWAGKELLNGTASTGAGQAAFSFHIGANTGNADSITVNISAMTSEALTLASGSGTPPVLGNEAVTGDASGSITIDDDAGTIEFATSEASGAFTDGAVYSLDIDGVEVSITVADDDAYLDTSGGVAQQFAVAIANTAALKGISVSVSGGTLTLERGGEVDISGTSTTASREAAILRIDAAIETVNTQRATLGSVSNRLDSTISNLTNISTNLEAGRSSIQDADFAAESTSLAKSQILQQASTAMLAQANASKQGVLQLLQG